MKLIAKSLDTSNLLNINFFEMRDKGFTPTLHGHRSDVFFDLIVEGVKFINVSLTVNEQNIQYLIYPNDVNISPFLLELPCGIEIVIFKEV